MSKNHTFIVFVVVMPLGCIS